jgi:hypothetical protein
MFKKQTFRGIDGHTVAKHSVKNETKIRFTANMLKKMRFSVLCQHWDHFYLWKIHLTQNLRWNILAKVYLLSLDIYVKACYYNNTFIFLFDKKIP